MSHNATTHVWGLQLGDARRKLALLKFADHAHDDGCNTWCKPGTVAKFVECSERTIQRIIGWLLSEGYMREGDQSAYVWPKGYGGPKEERFHPIVYDIAMDEETRQEWKRLAAEGGNARRDGHAAGGGLRRSADRGDNLTPQVEINTGSENAQVSGGDNLTPPPTCGSSGAPPEAPGVTKQAGSGVTNDHPPVDPSFATNDQVSAQIQAPDPGVTLLSPQKPSIEPKAQTPKPLSPTLRDGRPAADGELPLDLGAAGDAADRDKALSRQTQILTAAYAERVRGRATQRLLKIVGSNVKRLLREDQLEPAVILAAIEEAAPRGYLDLDRVIAAPGGPAVKFTRAADRKRMFARWDQLAAEIDARRAAS